MELMVLYFYITFMFLYIISYINHITLSLHLDLYHMSHITFDHIWFHIAFTFFHCKI